MQHRNKDLGLSRRFIYFVEFFADSFLLIYVLNTSVFSKESGKEKKTWKTIHWRHHHHRV